MERPYTRKSKYREKSYIKGIPGSKITRFELGKTNGVFPYAVNLVSAENKQLRHNALESARVTINRSITKAVGDNGYHLIVKAYPHHIIREHKIAAGAGADRFSKGMKKAYGKPAGVAAQVKTGTTIISLRIDDAHIDSARAALLRATKKLGCAYKIEVQKLSA